MSGFKCSAVGGVLLFAAPSATSEQLEPATNCLLLAWLAARKETPNAVTLTQLESTLAKVGWVSGSVSTTSVSVGWSGFGANLWRSTLGDDANVAAFIAALGALTAPQNAVLQAWWSDSQAASRGTLLVASLSSDGGLRLAALSPSLADNLRVYVDTPGAIQASLVNSTLTLNPSVYGTVANTVAQKIAPYLNLIVTA